MSTAMKTGASPAERGFAWAAAFLLAVFLTVTILGTMAVQTMTSAGLHLNVAADSSLLEKQYLEICNEIDVMAAEYGFSADEVKAAVTMDELKEINRKSAEWWTWFLTEGESRTFPKWDSSSFEKILYTAGENGELGEEPQTIAADLTKMIENTVFPMRNTTLTFGSKMAKDMADIRGLIRALRKMPMLGLVLCLACAGGIALLLGRDFFSSLKYFGTSLAGAGIAAFAGCFAILAVRSDNLLAEASKGLADEIHTLFGKTALGVGLSAGVLLLIGYCFLLLYHRETGKANPKGTERTA